MTIAAIFDLDGTLVTFELDIREWRRAVLDVMGRLGFDRDGLDANTPTQQILDFAKGQAAADETARFDELRRETFSVLDSLELKGAAVSRVFPGVREVLQELKSDEVRLGVLTNSGRAAALKTLAESGLLDFFEFVLTRDDTEAMKPRPEGLLKAVGMLGPGTGEIYYVGDSVYDVRAAKEAGIKVVAITTGSYGAERLRMEGADFVMDSLAGLPRILSQPAK